MDDDGQVDSTDELQMQGQSLEERLLLDKAEHWERIRTTWTEARPLPSDVDCYLSCLHRYCRGLPPSAMELRATFPREALGIFLQNGGLSRAVDLALRTAEIMLANPPLMLDALTELSGTEVATVTTTLPGTQVACMAANFLLCTLFECEDGWSYPPLTGRELYTAPAAVGCVKALLGLLSAPPSLSDWSPPPALTVTRLRAPANFLAMRLKSAGDSLLPPVRWCAAADDDCPRVVFSDAYLGGAVLGKGRGQEEDLMREHPATITALLLCMRVGDTEAIVISGHEALLDTGERRPAPTYIFIDAWPFAYNPTEDQHGERWLRRELTKALVGFHGAAGDEISTSGWGCGTFGGAVPLKFLLQHAACALSGKTTMRWERDFCEDFVAGDGQRMAKFISEQKMTAREVWDFLLSYGADPPPRRLNLADALVCWQRPSC